MYLKIKLSPYDHIIYPKPPFCPDVTDVRTFQRYLLGSLTDLLDRTLVLLP